MQRTRTALLDALLRLLERSPFDQITIRAITREAGVGYATFFRHYPTKDALLDELASDQIGTLLDLSLPVLHDADSRASTLTLCRYVDSHRAVWTALLTGGAAGTLREAFLRLARQIPIAPGPSVAWLPEELRLIHGTTSTIEVLAWWLKQRQDFSAAQVAEILNRLVIAPTIALADE